MWGFRRHPGRDARSGFEADINAHTANLVHEIIYPKIRLIQVWVDCRSLNLIVNGAEIDGDPRHQRLSEVGEDWDVGSASDARYFRKNFLLAKTIFESILTMSTTYSIKRTTDIEKLEQDSRELVARVRNDLAYVRRYFFEEYRGRKIAERG